MIKIITILIISFSFLHANKLSQTTQNIHTYPVGNGNVGLKASYNIISENMDIFGLRSDTNGLASSHGSLGDMQGFDVSASYGYNEYTSFLYTYEYKDIDYASTSLKNSMNELMLKLNIYHNPSAMIDTYSADIGFIHNSSDDLTIPNSSLGISKMDDMSDSSLYLRLLAGSKIMSSVLDFYMGLKFTSISTTLDNVSYDRNEVAINAGFQYTIELGNFLIETGYEYIRLVNREVSNDESSNHVMNITFSRVITPKLLFYVGGKFYINQLNGVIPYLYNEKTKDTFDQKYGYATFGVVYNFNFDTNGLNKKW